jgi:hypothetical protein
MLQDIMEQSILQKYSEGMRYARDERVFRYAHAGNGLTALWGALTYMPTTEHGVLTADAPAGSTVLHCTAVGTVVADQFKGGYAVLSWNVGAHRIKSNTGAAPAGAFTVTLEDATWRDFTVATDCTLYTNEYHDVRCALGIPEYQGHSTFVGIPLINVTNAYWCWLQTWGPIPGMGVAAQGAAVGERACYFYGDGAVINQTEMVAGPGQALQYAGELLPFTGPASSPVDVTNAMIFMNLRLKP